MLTKHKLFYLLLKRYIESNVSAQRRIDARLSIEFSKWLQDKRYLENVREDEAAGEMNMTREQLSFFCATVMGRPFRQLRKEYRIREATVILRLNPDISLETLGGMVGIPDKSNFRKQFRDVLGCSPREWLDDNL